MDCFAPSEQKWPLLDSVKTFLSRPSDKSDGDSIKTKAREKMTLPSGSKPTIV